MARAWWRENLVPTVVTLSFHILLVYLASAEWLFRGSTLNVAQPSVLRASLGNTEALLERLRQKQREAFEESKIVEPKPLPKAEPLKIPVPDAPEKFDNNRGAQSSEQTQEVPFEHEIPPPPDLEALQQELETPAATDFDESALNELLRAETQRLDTEKALLAQKIAVYVDAIARRIEANWRRPPNARRNMEVLLELHLLPSGHVQGVRVLRGSGFETFDDSAISAVRRISAFPELKNMEPDIFDSEFRRLSLLFRPDDLKR